METRILTAHRIVQGLFIEVFEYIPIAPSGLRQNPLYEIIIHRDGVVIRQSAPDYPTAMNVALILVSALKLANGKY